MNEVQVHLVKGTSIYTVNTKGSIQNTPSSVNLALYHSDEKLFNHQLMTLTHSTITRDS